MLELHSMTKQELIKLLKRLTNNGEIDETELVVTNIELFAFIQQVRSEINKRAKK